jgi:hypothetical protein
MKEGKRAGKAKTPSIPNNSATHMVPTITKLFGPEVFGFSFECIEFLYVP